MQPGARFARVLRNNPPHAAPAVPCRLSLYRLASVMQARPDIGPQHRHTQHATPPCCARWSHGIISTETRDGALANCDFASIYPLTDVRPAAALPCRTPAQPSPPPACELK